MYSSYFSLLLWLTYATYVKPYYFLFLVSPIWTPTPLCGFLWWLMSKSRKSSFKLCIFTQLTGTLFTCFIIVLLNGYVVKSACFYIRELQTPNPLGNHSSQPNIEVCCSSKSFQYHIDLAFCSFFRSIALSPNVSWKWRCIGYIISYDALYNSDTL